MRAKPGLAFGNYHSLAVLELYLLGLPRRVPEFCPGVGGKGARSLQWAVGHRPEWLWLEGHPPAKSQKER